MGTSATRRGCHGAYQRNAGAESTKQSSCGHSQTSPGDGDPLTSAGVSLLLHRSFSFFFGGPSGAGSASAMPPGTSWGRWGGSGAGLF